MILNYTEKLNYRNKENFLKQKQNVGFFTAKNVYEKRIQNGGVSKNAIQKQAAVPASGNSRDDDFPRVPVRLGECSFLADITKPAKLSAGKLGDYINGIKSGAWREKVEQVRAGTLDKNKLPELNVFGVYRSRRSDENLVSRSGFLVLDFDAKDNAPATLARIRAATEKLSSVLAAFASPSGKGLKVLIRVPDGVSDKAAFDELCVPAFAPLGGVIDANAPARKRCFVSFDASAFVNPAPLDKIPPLAKLDALPLPDLLAIFSETESCLYCTGKDYLEHLESQSTFATRMERQAWRKFENRGFPKERRGELLEYISKHKHLARVETALSGHRAGIYEENGLRFAVCQSPKTIQPKRGEWKNIERVLRARFDDIAAPYQYEILLAWLSRARERIEKFLDANSKGENSPKFFVPALEIIGEKSLGKSSIFTEIIAPLLGGRVVDATKVLAQGARFNGDAKGAEILLVDDISEKDVATISRAGFADNIKKYCFAAAVSGESKGQDERTLSGACYFVVQLVNPEKIFTTPDFETAKDKILVLCAGEYRELAEKTDEAFEKLNKMIAAELPAFAYYLDNDFLPDPEIIPDEDSLEEKRIGMKLFVHPHARELIGDADPAESLLLNFDTRTETLDDAAHSYETKLTARLVAEKAGLRIADRQTSVYLQTLKKRYPDRVEQLRDETGAKQSRGWIIHKPPK